MCLPQRVWFGRRMARFHCCWAYAEISHYRHPILCYDILCRAVLCCVSVKAFVDVTFIRRFVRIFWKRTNKKYAPKFHVWFCWSFSLLFLYFLLSKLSWMLSLCTFLLWRIFGLTINFVMELTQNEMFVPLILN